MSAHIEREISDKLAKLLKALKKWLRGPAQVPRPTDAETLAGHPSLCMMPWVHLHVTQTGEVTPCCQAPWDPQRGFGSVNEMSVREIWNGAPMRKFRQGMLAGKVDARCQACFAKEKDGFRSLRNVTNQDYAHHLDRVAATGADGHLTVAEPIYLDLRFSNICNFKCRICGPWSSSQWHNDAVALGMKSPQQKAIDKSVLAPDAFWAQVEALVPGLEEIYFAGGEPLMMEEHYEFLEMLHRHGKFDLTLKYNTNLSVLKLKDWEVTSLWQPFKKVIVAASLDGSGKRGEYQRKNQDWSEVVRIREQLAREVPNLFFLISPTISVFNVLHVVDFHREWMAEGWVGAFDLIPSILQQPAYYAIEILPAALKAEASAKVEQHLAWLVEQPTTDPAQKAFAMGQWRGVVNRLAGGGDAALLEKLKTQTLALDRLRGEDVCETFPELASIFS